jgi:energy-coupling factor transport system substrate-specific component
MWVSGASIAAVVLVNFLPAAIVDLIVGLILVPILMVAYNAVLSRSGR